MREEKKKEKETNKQSKIKTATQGKYIHLNKEEPELICEAFFFSFLRKNIGDFYFQAAPICNHLKIENYVNFNKCLLYLLGSQEY